MGIRSIVCAEGRAVRAALVLDSHTSSIDVIEYVYITYTAIEDNRGSQENYILPHVRSVVRCVVERLRVREDGKGAIIRHKTYPYTLYVLCASPQSPAGKSAPIQRNVCVYHDRYIRSLRTGTWKRTASEFHLERRPESAHRPLHSILQKAKLNGTGGHAGRGRSCRESLSGSRQSTALFPPVHSQCSRTWTKCSIRLHGDMMVLLQQYGDSP